MKNAPNRCTLKSLWAAFNDGPSRQTPDGRWVPARPIGFYSVWSRLKLAWGVFTGKYDALDWED